MNITIFLVIKMGFVKILIIKWQSFKISHIYTIESRCVNKLDSFLWYW